MNIINIVNTEENRRELLNICSKKKLNKEEKQLFIFFIKNREK